MPLNQDEMLAEIEVFAKSMLDYRLTYLDTRHTTVILLLKYLRSKIEGNENTVAELFPEIFRPAEALGGYNKVKPVKLVEPKPEKMTELPWDA